MQRVLSLENVPVPDISKPQLLSILHNVPSLFIYSLCFMCTSVWIMVCLRD